MTGMLTNGFGHATRAVVTIKALATLGHHVVIVSSAPPFIFRDTIESCANCELRSIATLCPGVIQKDPVTVDVAETMRQLDVFWTDAKDVVGTEAEWMKGARLDVVCLDAPFLPASVAKQLGIPSILLTNFTFDAIFSALANTPKATHLVSQCTSMYNSTDLLLRMPGHIPIPAFTHRPDHIIDISLIVRKSRESRTAVREMLDIPVDAPCVLITFGGFELGEDVLTEEKVLPDGWYGLLACRSAGADALGRLRRIRTDRYYMPDLINAADVVMGKCGYGTCSEVVAHNVPLVYVPRSGFETEEEGLVGNLMGPYGHAVEMPQTDFYAGNWAGYIAKAAELRAQPVREQIAHDGEILAAETVVAVGRRKFPGLRT
ncbi:uncharacterized protein EV422DRAFT_433260 [Fimicolochytrium jonesii]|uniref:uncharacterized protein n=1 Tax=Fimicolochytrium jonesii TaxID=1396493 RepID=UPI0022FE6B51|nr:uncharacterized protein EV422DRAFT_433260 [Fimicolochytrium jonesii]KAI8821812.1 hypothetical protein EV422DRAFT_433260 [Fimicolochytrium jonesii]